MTLFIIISSFVYLCIGIVFALFVRHKLKDDGGKPLTVWEYVFIVVTWGTIVLYLIFNDD